VYRRLAGFLDFSPLVIFVLANASEGEPGSPLLFGPPQAKKIQDGTTFFIVLFIIFVVLHTSSPLRIPARFIAPSSSSFLSFFFVLFSSSSFSRPSVVLHAWCPLLAFFFFLSRPLFSSQRRARQARRDPARLIGSSSFLQLPRSSIHVPLLAASRKKKKKKRKKGGVWGALPPTLKLCYRLSLRQYDKIISTPRHEGQASSCSADE
jgi:hypothetical protein